MRVLHAGSFYVSMRVYVCVRVFGTGLVCACVFYAYACVFRRTVAYACARVFSYSAKRAPRVRACFARVGVWAAFMLKWI